MRRNMDYPPRRKVVSFQEVTSTGRTLARLECGHSELFSTEVLSHLPKERQPRWVYCEACRREGPIE